MPSVLRRFVLGQDTTKNWTLQKTTTFVVGSPADSPIAWPGTVSDMEQDFRATTGAQTALGALLTFTTIPDGFGGVIVKVATTYGVSDLPRIELWSHTVAGGWVLRRSVLISNLDIGARSGEAKIYDLTLSTQLTLVDKFWVTIKPTSTESNTFLAIHPYGSCDIDIVLPTCDSFEGGCLPEAECLDPATWTTDPDCSAPEPSTLDGSDPDGPFPDPNPDATVPFEFPPFLLDINGPPASRYAFGQTVPGGPRGWYVKNNCVGSIENTEVGFAMIFGVIPTGGSVLVEYLPSSTLKFSSTADPTDPAVFSQTISVAGTMNWRIKSGTGFYTPSGSQGATTDPAGTAAGLFYPPPFYPIQEFYRFRFTPKGTLSAFQLFDILAFFWTTTFLVSSRLC